MISKLFEEFFTKIKQTWISCLPSLKIDLFVEIHNGLKCGVLKAPSAQGMGHLYQTPITHGLGNFADDRTEEFQSNDEKQTCVVMTFEWDMVDVQEQPNKNSSI